MFVWILDRTIDPIYTPADVRALTGATAPDLQNWANRGLLKPVASKAGKGGVRHYSKMQVACVKVAKWLAPLGIETAHAMEIALGGLVGALQEIQKIFQPITERPDLDGEASSGIMRSDLVKAVINTVVLVKVGKSGERSYEAHSMHDLKTEAFVQHALGLTPALTIPIGILLGQLQRAEIDSGLAASLKERPSVGPTKRAAKAKTATAKPKKTQRAGARK